MNVPRPEALDFDLLARAMKALKGAKKPQELVKAISARIGPICERPGCYKAAIEKYCGFHEEEIEEGRMVKNRGWNRRGVDCRAPMTPERKERKAQVNRECVSRHAKKSAAERRELVKIGAQAALESSRLRRETANAAHAED
jgi:hypothetical protein